MWSFSVDGFLSIVEFDPPNVKIKNAVYGVKEDGKTDWTNIIEPAEYGTEKVCQEQIDQLVGYVPATKTSLSSHLLVRARVEADMDPLKKYDPNAVFFSDLTADYQFRCIISRLALAMYQASLVMGINYSSHVKEEMNRRAPQVAGGRMSAHSAIWSAMSKLQPNPPYGHVTGSMYGYSYGSADRDKDKKSSSYFSGTKYGGWGSSHYNYRWDNDKKKYIYDDKKDVVDGQLDLLTDDEWVDYDDSPGADDPGWGMTELDMRVASGDVSSETMRLQLKELLQETNQLDLFDLDNAVDAITDSCGTIDLNNVEEDVLWSILDGLNPDVVSTNEEDTNASNV